MLFSVKQQAKWQSREKQGRPGVYVEDGVQLVECMASILLWVQSPTWHQLGVVMYACTWEVETGGLEVQDHY